MAGLYKRGNVWYVKYRDGAGWVYRSTGTRIRRDAELIRNKRLDKRSQFCYHRNRWRNHDGTNGFDAPRCGTSIGPVDEDNRPVVCDGPDRIYPHRQPGTDFERKSGGIPSIQTTTGAVMTTTPPQPQPVPIVTSAHGSSSHWLRLSSFPINHYLAGPQWKSLRDAIEKGTMR
jgi:hypothetical protein